MKIATPGGTVFDIEDVTHCVYLRGLEESCGKDDTTIAEIPFSNPKFLQIVADFLKLHKETEVAEVVPTEDIKPGNFEVSEGEKALFSPIEPSEVIAFYKVTIFIGCELLKRNFTKFLMTKLDPLLNNGLEVFGLQGRTVSEEEVKKLKETYPDLY
jgi:hypothetical protein